MDNKIRKSAVADKFYPGERGELKDEINYFLEKAENEKVLNHVRALMLPHASYFFCGEVLGGGYNQIKGESRNTVILMCSSHQKHFEGIALSNENFWETPLGQVEVDQELGEKLSDEIKEINYDNSIFEGDHTLEIHIPFLQESLKDGFKILPIIFGEVDLGSCKNFSKKLCEYLTPGDLIIASTDMSHFPPYEEANRIDNETLDIIASLDLDDLENHVINIEEKNIIGEETLLCGIDGVKIVMKTAKLLEWNKGKILKYLNSGDISGGDKDRVVGYGSVVFTDKNERTILSDKISDSVNQILNSRQRETLLEIARKTVENFISLGDVPDFNNVEDEILNKAMGAFVTLKTDGKLRGCIGQIVQTEDPLWRVIQNMAIASATEDDRFSPVEKKELPNLEYEISVLSVPERIDDWHDFELGLHEVVIKKGDKSGVFLPSVAKETLWNKEEFLSKLCSMKAGLSPNAYRKDPEVEIYVFTTETFSSED